MKKNIFFLLYLFVFLISSREAVAKTIHAILVVDTVHDNISFATKPDLKHIQDELRVIAKHSQVTLKEKIFSGSEFQKSKVIAYLNHLNIDPSDTVFFYFSGHGYRTKQTISPFPHLTFEFYKSGLELQWIADAIRHKKPRFALVIADCCNNFVERGFNNASKSIQVNLQIQPPYYPGYQQLFANAKGCVVVSSSSAGQFSYGCRLGGLFTQCFLMSLNKEIAETSPNWKRLVDRASSYISRVQKPVCEIYQ